MAVAYAIDPTLVETMKVRVGVETKDGLTLGMTVVTEDIILYGKIFR